MTMFEIDGTFGEGGGQILRTSLALAALTGKPFRISRIRGKRKKPGLRRQHLTGVRAAQTIARAEVRGADLDSTELTFVPGGVAGGDHTFDVGTAGSALLVLQTILPPLFRAGGPSTVTVRGGTHNPMSPPFDFVAESFLPAIGRMGFRAQARLGGHGFYPAGGGEVTMRIEPAASPQPAEFTAPTGPCTLRARVLLSRLPGGVWNAERLALESTGLPLTAIERRDVTDSPGPGNCVMIVIDRDPADPRNAVAPNGRDVGRTVRSILTAFGERGRPSAAVVGEVAGCARELLDAAAGVDRFLADQLLLYLAMAGGGSLTTPVLTLHAETNMAVIEKFLPVRFETERIGQALHVRCRA